jgi:TRAP-type C4-dicarboxylate transport system permease large subunit
MLMLYLILGTVMDSLAMIFLTVPIFVPIIAQLDFGIPTSEVIIWFGILVLMSAEIGLITPPVGLNLFVINALAKDVTIGQTYRGALPFVVSDILRIAILVAFPGITLGLGRLLYG